MNRHIIIDRLFAQTMAIELGRHVFFADEIESPSFEDHIDAVTVHVPEITGEGIYEVSALTLAGELDPAFNVLRWLGPGKPTIIFHHGTAERPFDTGRGVRNVFHHMFGEGNLPEANVIALRAPYHAGTARAFSARMRRLANLMAMVSSSVKLIEHLTACCGVGKVCVSGISLGGFIVNIHRAYYNSARAYVPLLAGAAPDDLFLESRFNVVTGHRALDNLEKVSRILNFEQAYSRIPDDNVFPLLARHDQYVRFERQKACYGNRSIRALEKGHITASNASADLRDHILGVMGTINTR